MQLIYFIFVLIINGLLCGEIVVEVHEMTWNNKIHMKNELEPEILLI